MKSLLFLVTILQIAQLGFADAAMGQSFSVTDIVGREVSFQGPVKRAILGEGRMLYVLAALERENPFRHIAGWRNDLKQADPATFEAYRKKFPTLDDIPTFSGLEQSLIDIEMAVAQRPDVVFLNYETKRATEDANYVEKLAALNIPVVYVDFRHNAMKNTEPSIRLFGRIFGRVERAEAFIEFRKTQIARVTDKLAAEKPDRPNVFIQRAGGYYSDCCHTFGDENVGKLVEIAGGHNIAASLLPGTFGQINPEQVIAANPDHVVVTSANWDAYVPNGAWVPVGPGADAQVVSTKLAAYTQLPAYTAIKAQKKRRFHALWHQFYNSPYQFVAIQQLAKWFHPHLFADLNPQRTFQALHDQFLPIDFQAGYFATLEQEGSF